MARAESAIENSMADEIWEQLKKGTLSNAATDLRTNNAPFPSFPNVLIGNPVFFWLSMITVLYFGYDVETTA